MRDWDLLDRCPRCGSPLREDDAFTRMLAAFEGLRRARYVCFAGHSLYRPAVEEVTA